MTVSSHALKVDHRCINIMRRHFIILVSVVSATLLCVLYQMGVKLFILLALAVSVVLAKTNHQLALSYLFFRDTNKKLTCFNLLVILEHLQL